jgi:hypothetical protein
MTVNVTLQSPGFYAREVEVFPVAVAPEGLGAGGVGTAQLGPAFVPITVSTANNLQTIFGQSVGIHQGIVAGIEYLNQGGGTYTYMRVLGAGTAPRTVFDGDDAYLSHTPNAGFIVGFPEHTGTTVDDDLLLEVIPQFSSSISNQLLKSTMNDSSNVYFLGGVFTDSATALSLETANVAQPKINNLSPLLKSSGEPGQFVSQFKSQLVDVASVLITSATGTTVIYPSPVEDPFVSAISLTDGVTAEAVSVTSGSNNVVFGISLDSSTTAEVAYSIYDLSGTQTATTASYLSRGVVFTNNNYKAVVSSTLGYSYFGEIYDNDGGALNTPADVSAFYDSSRFRFAIIKDTVKGSDGFFKPDPTDIVFGPVNVSFNPNENAYFADVLNTDPALFVDKGHVLYSHYDVLDSQVSMTGTISGTVDAGSSPSAVSLPTFTVDAAPTSGTLAGKFPRYTPVFCLPPQSNYNAKWHNYIDRFKTAVAPTVTSQAIGGFEYDLFKVHSRHDGVNGNFVFKVSISNIRYPTTDAEEYPTFSLSVRAFNDTDRRPVVLESFTNLNLDPASERFAPRVIGDVRTFLDLDEFDEEDRKLVDEGDYANQSNFIRLEPTDALQDGRIPREAIPFGYAGIETLDLGTVDVNPGGFNTFTTSSTGGTVISGSNLYLSSFSDAITFNGVVNGAYRGDFSALVGNQAQVGLNKQQWLPVTDATLFNVSASFSLTSSFQFYGDVNGTIATAAGETVTIAQSFTSDQNENPAPVPPPYRESITRGSINSNIGVRRDLGLFWGFKTEETDLSSPQSNLDPNASQIPNDGVRAFSLFYGVPETGNLLTGSAADAYQNNKFTLSNVELGPEVGTSLADLQTVTISDAVKFRYKRAGVAKGTGSLGDVVALDKKNRVNIWNRINAVCKFTFPVRGGFDGVNIQDADRLRLNNQSVKDGAATGSFGESQEVYVYNEAARVMLDAANTDIEIFVMPGITEPLVTDLTIQRTEDYFDAIYILDIDQSDVSNVRDAVAIFEARSLDTSFAATYFPNVRVNDPTVGRGFEVSPSTVVLGAIALNDTLGQPWFAPAGLSRGALSNVTSTTFRLKQSDRDLLYDTGINPIVSLPGQGFVVFGQKTLDQGQGSLNRVNIRRLLVRTRRVVRELSDDILFEQYNQSSVDRYRLSIDAALSEIQRLSGISRYRIELSPNFNSNRLDGRITIVPIRAIEFVTIDFIVDRSGVTFG